jgi:hypothetical protein
MGASGATDTVRTQTGTQVAMQGNCSAPPPPTIRVDPALLKPQYCVVETPDTFLRNAAPFGNKLWLNQVWVQMARDTGALRCVTKEGHGLAHNVASGSEQTAHLAQYGIEQHH